MPNASELAARPEAEIAVTYRALDGRTVESGHLPSGLVEVDADFIGLMVQRAYEQGAQDQFEVAQRQIAQTMTDLRHLFERRGKHQ